MIYSQAEIFDYLKQNPLYVEVNVGDIDDMNGKDYIFFDYVSDSLLGSDNRGVYQTYVQITIATRDFEKRKILVDYVKRLFNVEVTYEKAVDFEYYIARMNCGILMNEIRKFR